MVKGCGANCARIILIVFNIIFWLSGAALLALGLYLIFSGDFDAPFAFLQEVDTVLESVNGSLLKYAAYAFIGIGAFVIIVGFCGCCGAIKENKCLLGTYIFFLVIIMLAEAAVGGLVIFFNEKILDTVSQTYKELATKKYVADDGFRAAVNHFQIQFECCGWKGLEDYENVTYLGVSGLIPSCCVINETATLPTDYASLDYTHASDKAGCEEKNAVWEQNCMDSVDDFLSEYSIILIGVGIGIACLELFGIIFACCLCRNIGD